MTEKGEPDTPDTRRKYEKLRLNIAVDKEAAERAKDMGFNISATFEEYLRVLTYRPKGEDIDVIKAYDSFLTKIQKIIDEYELEIEIGEVPENIKHLSMDSKIDFSGCKIVLDRNIVGIYKDGKFYSDMKAQEEYNLLMDPYEMEYLYEPQRILKNLISEIKKKVADNNVKIQKLNLAMKFAETLFNDLENSSESGIGTPSLRQTLKAAGKTNLQETIPA
jgi:hypothetical protein